MAELPVHRAAVVGEARVPIRVVPERQAEYLVVGGWPRAHGLKQARSDARVLVADAAWVEQHTLRIAKQTATWSRLRGTGPASRAPAGSCVPVAVAALPARRRRSRSSPPARRPGDADGAVLENRNVTATQMRQGVRRSVSARRSTEPCCAFPPLLDLPDY